MYEMYTPTITKIEVMKLEKRLDDDLSYLVDAYPEYSTFNIHMEPTSHVIGKPVPINPLKVNFYIPITIPCLVSLKLAGEVVPPG